MSFLTNPVSATSRFIENLIIQEEKMSYFATKSACHLTSKIIATVVFPIFLVLELAFKRVPKLLIACIYKDQVKIRQRFEKIHKFAYSILCSPLGLLTADAVSVFFLKTKNKPGVIAPFGVEKLYGAYDKAMIAPRTKQELVAVVKQAIKEGKQISVLGAGFSQGPQTLPSNQNHLVVDLQHINQVFISEDKTTVDAQAGACWEMVQKVVNAHKKSVIVKQASDPFSIGGSIAINCHGWAHAEGALANTVERLEVINAQGELEIIDKSNPKFGLFFGTLGYFGVIVSAKFRLEDNTQLVAQCEEIDTENFVEVYKQRYKDADIPLFYGRLSLDSTSQAPLQKVCMQKYTKINQTPEVSPFELEPKFGQRIERIFIQAVGHLNNFFAQRLIKFFWYREKKLMMSINSYTRNEILHPPINCFKKLKASHLHAQWLQEYFLTAESLGDFIKFLGPKLKDNNVRLINASIRPVPKDNVSVLPYADQDRYAVVLCFHQLKTEKEVAKTKQWIQEVNQWLLSHNGRYYQAYMPFSTQTDFETCYGQNTLQRLRDLKQLHDPYNIFGNAHTKKYFQRS